MVDFRAKFAERRARRGKMRAITLKHISISTLPATYAEKVIVLGIVLMFTRVVSIELMLTNLNLL